MTRRVLLTLFAVAAASMAAQADVLYRIDLSTPGPLTGAAYIDIQFNKADSVNSPNATAELYGYTGTGYAFGSGIFTSAGVTGDINNLPVTIPNNPGAANYYAQEVTTFGSALSLYFRFSGAALLGGGSAPSALYVLIEDTDGAPIIGTGPSGEVASITIDGSGLFSYDTSGGPGVSASIAPVPEPATLFLAVAAGAGMLLVRRLRR